jgi:hypothetical protein
VLKAYDRHALDSLVDSSATMAVMTYRALHRDLRQEPVAHRDRADRLLRSDALPAAHAQTDLGQEPDRLLLTDRTLQACIVLWLIAFRRHLLRPLDVRAVALATRGSLTLCCAECPARSS